jgi:hypothetical protein
MAMARKNEVNSAPVVTSLPLPSSDSVLVIDLPDGQKLLVGKMNHGTVIEVATWRGTGRPDSRTNRLMLGMSSSDSDSQVNSQEAAEEMVVDKRSIKYWIWLTVQLSKKVKDLANSLWLKIKSLITKKSDSLKSSKPSDSIEDDVQAWLDNIKLNKPKKSDRPLPAVVTSKSTSKSTSTAAKIKKKSSNTVKSRSKA